MTIYFYYVILDIIYRFNLNVVLDIIYELNLSLELDIIYEFDLKCCWVVMLSYESCDIVLH
jgi:hypothetical protein